MRHILKLIDSGRSPVRFLCGLALASAMLTGCVREDSEVPAGPGRTGEAEISFTVDGLAATRAVAITPHEAKVSDVDILFFDRDVPMLLISMPTCPWVQINLHSTFRPN